MSGSESDIDWLSVEKDYRPGMMPLRAIGTKYGCTEGAIRKKARKEGWVRDLSAKIESKAAELVRKAEVRKKYADASELDVINANANVSAAIQLAERKDITKARSIVMSMFRELEDQTDDVDGYVKVGEILATENTKALQDRYNKAVGFSGRVDNMKKLADAIKTLIELERKVYKIDADPEGDENKKVNLLINFK